VFTEVITEISPTVCGADDPTQILEVNGTGLALFDYDRDGDLDLFVVNAASLDNFASGPGCRLYENQSDELSIVFIDVTERAQISVFRWANGVAVGDANGDGYDDLYITCHGPNILLLNNGDGTFSDATVFAGVGDDRWGTSATFGDLDGDGDLDLYVCNYLAFDPSFPPARARYKGQSVLGGPHGMEPQADIVYENNGDGTFTDVTKKWGFNTSPAFSLNVAILDFTGDGRQDIFVGNDSMSNHLFVNTGETPTRFENIGMQSGVAMNGDGGMQATMGIGIADVSGNGRPDIFTTNFSSDTNTLHVNDASGFFDDRTRRYRLGLMSRSLLGWTCGFHDFDLDGDEDLFIVNGHVYPEATVETIDSSRSQPVVLLERQGAVFNEHSQHPLCVLQVSMRARTAVFGDLDRDGDTDVIIAQRSGTVRVLENKTCDQQALKPLVIILEGTDQNPHGLGAAIHLTLDDDTVLSRWNHDGSGFQSSMSVPVVIAFPKGRTPKKLEVIWADGSRQLIDQVPLTGEFIVRQSAPQ